MRISLIFCAVTFVAQVALAQTETVYQTPLEGSASYRTHVTQVTGNAMLQFGDEIQLGGTGRYLTNVALGTQTWKAPSTAPYTPAFIRLNLYANDGPTAGGTYAVPTPGTLITSVTVPGPSYPAGGIAWDDPSDGVVVNFPLPNVFVPEKFTFSFVNLDHNGNPDVTWGVDPVTRQPLPPNPNYSQQPSFNWGPWLSRGRTTSLVSGQNTNPIGNSNTGPWVSNTNPGAWYWVQGSSGNWSNGGGDTRLVPEAKMTAAFSPLFADMNGDFQVNNLDIQPFEIALTNAAAHSAQYKLWSEDVRRRGDINHDGDFNNLDIQPFEKYLTSGASVAAVTAVPEPASGCLAAIGLLACALVAYRRSGALRLQPVRIPA